MNPVIISASLLAFVVAMAMSEPAPGATGTTTTVTTSASTTGPSTVPTDKYVSGKGARFESLAGSHDNLVSLVNGLRTGSEITLVSPAPTPTPTGTPPAVTKSTFTSPTRPMGYGNITHALDFAQRELAAAGIKNPTTAQLQAALMGGTVKTANGDVQLQGILQLRSQGMGWGKIAHTVGIFPSSHASAKAVANAGTSAGASGGSHGSSGIVTAAGGTVGASNHSQGHSHSGIVTAAGGSSAGAGNAGGNNGVRTAAGSAGGGNGNGNAYGRAGK